MRKKRQRIPRRGPGVAELEKILKEQEGQDSDTQDMSPPPPPPFLFQPHHDSPSILTLNPSLPPPPPLLVPPPLPFLPPPPPPPLSPVPFLPPPSRPNLPLFPTLRLMPPPLPTTEKPVFPLTPKSYTQMNIPPHVFPNFQFSASLLNPQYYNSMENFTPASASSSPSATSSAARYFNPIEHPSSQRSSDFNHPWTSPEEQEQMVSAKRTRPFLDDSHRDPNFESRRDLQSLLNIGVKEGSSSSSSSEMNRSAIYLDSNLRLGEDSSNLMALRSSATQNQSAPFHFQETMEASQHREGGSSQADAKPEREIEAKEDDIDLDLKL